MHFPTRMASLVSGILFAAACSTPASAPRGLSTADSTALREIAERDAAMVLSRDFAAMTAGYTEDAVRMPPNAPALVGRPAIRANLDLGAGRRVAIEPDDEDAVGRGGGQGFAIHEDEGARPSPADGVAALNQRAGEAQVAVISRPDTGRRQPCRRQGTAADQKLAARQDHGTWPRLRKASFGPA